MKEEEKYYVPEIEDIESLGFTHIPGEKDLFFGQENKFTLNKEVGFNTGTDYTLHLYPKGKIHLKWETYSSGTNHKGALGLRVKNKSELKRLLKQLGV